MIYRKNKIGTKGFTLLELIIVIAIIGILSTLLMANYIAAQQRGRDTKRKSDLKQIQAALELYRADNGHYPCTINDWEYSNSSGSWLYNASSVCTESSPFSAYMANLPRDPINNGAPFYGTAYTYAYYSNYNLGSGCSAAGTYYLLVTSLENKNDTSSDTNAQEYKNGQLPCKDWYGGNSVQTIWGSNVIILTNP